MQGHACGLGLAQDREEMGRQGDCHGLFLPWFDIQNVWRTSPQKPVLSVLTTVKSKWMCIIPEAGVMPQSVLSLPQSVEERG